MKRSVLLFVAFMILSVHGYSQFGIKAGWNFNKMEDIRTDNSIRSSFDNNTGFHAGILYKIKIPMTGISLQPELIYTQNKAKCSLLNSEDIIRSNFKRNELQLAAGLQWGIDLMLLRPFVQVVPYLGLITDKSTSISNIRWDIDQFRYGIGLGAGMDIWKFQISGKYNWDLGEVAKYKGFFLSVAYMF